VLAGREQTIYPTNQPTDQTTKENQPDSRVQLPRGLFCAALSIRGPVTNHVFIIHAKSLSINPPALARGALFLCAAIFRLCVHDMHSLTPALRKLDLLQRAPGGLFIYSMCTNGATECK
jgi:hypothetical protein